MNLARQPLTALLALTAALATPMAFAQTASPSAQDSAMQSAQPTTTSAPATGSAPAAAPKQVTWADLDTDKDGNLSKAEVSSVPTLGQVFDQADTDKDGKLTADEYKTFAAANSGGAGSGASGN